MITGTYPTADKDAVQLAAWQFQAKFGGHNPSSHRPGFLSQTLVEYVPGPHMEKAGRKGAAEWEQLIFHKHAFSTSGVPRETYCGLLAKRDYYGAVMFAVKQKYDRSLPRKLFLGISRRGILLLRIPTDPINDDMETLARFPLVSEHRLSGQGRGQFAATRLSRRCCLLISALRLSPPPTHAGRHLPLGVQARRELLL